MNGMLLEIKCLGRVPFTTWSYITLQSRPLDRLEQEDVTFKTCLGYKASSRVA